jgi:hypothetical protein
MQNFRDAFSSYARLVPFSKNPNVVTFITLFIVFNIIISFSSIGLYIFIVSGGTLKYKNSNFDQAVVMFLMVLWEEIFRWSFSIGSINLIKSNIKFFIFIITFETIVGLAGSKTNFIDYLINYRLGGIIMHFIFGVMCYHSIRKNNWTKSLIYFSLTLLTHFAFNQYFEGFDFKLD